MSIGLLGSGSWEEGHVCSACIVDTDGLHDVLFVIGSFSEPAFCSIMAGDSVRLWYSEAEAGCMGDERVLLMQRLCRFGIELNGTAIGSPFDDLFGFTIFRGGRNA